MQEQQITHQCSAKLFALARTFAAKQDVRYYLNGVHIRRAGNGYGGGCVIEATNGHLAVVIHDKEGVSTEAGAIISGTVTSLLPKTGKVSVLEDGTVTQGGDLFDKKPTANASYPNALLDAVYPNVARVFPDFSKLKPGINTVGFNPEYLLQALKFFNALGGTWASACFYQNEDDFSSLLITNTQRSAFVIVMPMRDDNKIARPEWVGGVA